MVAAGCYQHPTAGCSVELSTFGILQIGPDIKLWRTSLPGVGEARLGACPGYGSRAFEGVRVRIQADATVPRWIRCLMREDGESEDFEFVLWRYTSGDRGASPSSFALPRDPGIHRV